eukprot:c2553_g1_i1 orf=96-4151(+)
MASSEQPALQIHTGPYKGDVSALCLLPAPDHHRHPLLLAGTGPQLLLFDTGSFELLLSKHVLEGVRMHGIEVGSQSLGHWVPRQESGVFTTIAVHGERTVKLYNLILEDGILDCQQKDKQIQLNLFQSLPRFKHWILDVRFLKEILFAGDVGNKQLLAVGSSDNCVFLWSMHSCAFVCQVECAERCLLYSLRLWGDDPESLLIAAGTIFNEIVVWDLGMQLLSTTSEHGASKNCFSFEESSKIVSPKGRLKGHEGSIFRIAWSLDGKRLASVSDDRSLRVWNIQKEPCESVEAGTEKDGFQLASVMYGHTARVWDCHIDSKFLITVSEDCTYRIWTVDGKPLVKMTAHLGRGIWRCVYDPSNDALITAGADSSIKVHFLSKWLSDVRGIQENEGSLLESTLALESFCLGSQAADIDSKRLEQLDSKSEYVRCLSLVGATCLYVGTNQGILKCVHFTKGGHETWFDIYSSLNCEPILCLDTLRLQEKFQRNDSHDAFEDWIVLGDGKGYVTVLCGSWVDDSFCQRFILKWPAEGERKLLGVFWSRPAGPSCIFTADPCGALCMWNLRHNDNQLAETSLDDLLCDGFARSPMSIEDPTKLWSSLAVRYQSTFNARIVCLDSSLEEELLVCGDQRGNIIVFLLPSLLCTQDVQPFPLASFKGAHGISTVASISITGKRNKEQIKICSTGRDGCICTFALEKSGGKLLCLRVEKVSAVTVVESCVMCNGITRAACARTIAAGFTAVDFLIYDLQNNCEIARVSCGGWRRPHAYLIGDFPEVQHCFVFVKDGLIHVFQKWFVAPKAASPVSMLPVANRSSFLSSLLIRSQFHGREIHSVNLVSSTHICKDQIHSTSWIATGAEDGVVRIMRFNEDTLEHFDVSQVLGEHVGGSAVRAVTSVTGYSLCNKHCPPLQDGAVSAESLCILISVGAKEVMTCWLLEWEEDFDRRGQPTQMLSSRWLSTKRCLRNRKPLKKSQDHANAPAQDNGGESQNTLLLEDAVDDDLRYLAVTAFSVFCPQTRLQICFAVTASSNATVMLHAFQLCAGNGNWVELCFLDYHKAPVLTLQYLVIPSCNSHRGPREAVDKYMVFSGATDGSIALWDVTDIVMDHCHQQSGQGCEKVFRPPSGRGSQGGRRRWKLSRRQEGDQRELVNETNNVEITLLDKCMTVEEALSHSKLNCNSDVESEWAVDHAKKRIPYPHTLKPDFLLPCAHQSGVNSLFVSTVKGEEHAHQNNRTCVVVSGGDDQALHVAIFTVDEKNDSVVCLVKESILSAHSSAIKGVWTDGSLVFSTGLDQRLRAWKLLVSKQCCSLVECCQTVINVPEPAALHVEHFNGRNYRIAVGGRGLQIFEVKGD